MANENIYPPFHSPLGRPLKFTPQQLAEKFAEYVQWCKDNPIILTNRTDYANGNYAINKEEKPRLISIGGFLTFIGSSESWWKNLEAGVNGEIFLKVKAQIKNYCENYQKEMASAGAFKENIISRLLGLADRKAVEHSGEERVIVESKEQADKLANIAQIG